MHDCNKQLKLQQQEEYLTNPNYYNNQRNTINNNDNHNINLYNLQQLLQFPNNIDRDTDIGIGGTDDVEKLSTTSTATTTTAAATVHDIQNLQLTQWWFLMMQQTIFNFKTTFEQQQQHKQIANLSNNNSNNNFTNNNTTVAASSVAGATNHFDIFNFINTDGDDHTIIDKTADTLSAAISAIEQQQK